MANASSSLLLVCLSATPGPALLDRLSQLDETGWRELVRSAAGHGVSPLLYDRLASLADTSASPSALRFTQSLAPCSIIAPATEPRFGGRSSTTPTSASQSGACGTRHFERFMVPMREAFFLHAARNALLYRDLAQVVASLQQHGLRVAVLKGAHLAALVYPHLGLRPMADMDLLVSEADLPRADTILRELGYYTKQPPSFGVRCQLGKHLPEYFKPSHPRIEIHWTIAPPALLPYKVDMVALFERLQSVTIAGVHTHVLSPSDFILHQCIHLAIHRFSLHGLRPICDLAATLHHHRDQLDWHKVQERAAAWQTDKCTYVALRLAHDLLGVVVPTEALVALRPTDFEERWYIIAREQLIEAGTVDLAGDSEANLALAGALSEGVTAVPLAEKLGFFLNTAFPSHDHMAVYMEQFHHLPLTGHRRYTCYLSRALDLAGRGLRLLRYSAAHRQETATRIRQVQQQTRLWRWLIGSEPKP